MGKFLEMCNLPRLNQKEIENMKRPIFSNKDESVILKLPTNKTQEETTSQVNSARHLKKSKRLSILLKLFHKIEEGETLPNSFYIAWIPWYCNKIKTPRKKKKRKLQANIADKHAWKISQQDVINSNINSTAH